MKDILLLICAIVYMVFGYFIVGKIGALFDENYKGYDYPHDKNTKSD